MFLSKKLGKRERTRQHSHSKQGLFCPGFFLSMPILNGLSYRSKPVQGFSHAIFTVFFLFSACLACQTRSKIVRRLNYISFDRDLTVLCQNPLNAVLRLCFSLSRGRFFPVKYLSSQVCQSTIIERVRTERICLSSAATLPDYQHLNAIPRVCFGCNASTKYWQLFNI